MPRKAQTEVISIVLLTGIIISLVGAAYMWGIPLINKRTAVTDFLAAEDFVVKLDQKIVEIANAGSGEAALDIPNGLIRVIDYDSILPDKNSIILEKIVKQPLILSNSVVLKTNVLGENGTYGEAEPRIINLSSESYGSDYRLIFTLHYRELDTSKEPLKGYLITLKTGEIAGTSRVVVSYDGTDVSGTAKNGGPLVRTRIKVSVV
jgi:flagellin-like protein